MGEHSLTLISVVLLHSPQAKWAYSQQNELTIMSEHYHNFVHSTIDMHLGEWEQEALHTCNASYFSYAHAWQ